MQEKSDYSFRNDASVPPFADDHPVVIVDGHCALCTGGIAWLLRLDRKARFRVTTIQTPLGRALYAHYGLNPDAYDTYMLVSKGKAYARTDGYIESCRQLGGIWKIFAVFQYVPLSWRDKVYWFLDRNRIKWFGTVSYCSRIPDKYKSRIIG